MLWQLNFFKGLTTLCQQWRLLHSIYQKVSQHTEWKWITDGLWNQIHKLSENWLSLSSVCLSAHYSLMKPLVLISVSYFNCISDQLYLLGTTHAVHSLQVEIGELKGRLTEVMSNCDALCKRIATEGPESLRSSVKPFATAAVDSEIRSSSSSVLKSNPPSNEAKSD